MIKNLTEDSVKNILVVRQHNQIGDMICSLPLYAALKKKFPSAEITLVAARTNYSIPFFDINPYINKVITFDKSTFSRSINFIRELRKRKYEIGIVPSTVKISRTSHIINFLSGAKVRVGVKSIDGKINSSENLLNVKKDFTWENVHQNIRNLDIVRQIGCDLNNEEINNIKLKLDDEPIDYAGDLKRNLFIDKEKLIIGFHPGAGKIKNVWESDNFISLIHKLNEKYQPYFIMTSGWTDKEITDYVKSELSKKGIEVLYLENLPVKKLAAVYNIMDLYITNDTGTMHIAGMTDVKLISLFGPTQNSEWAPNGKNKFFVQSSTKNINDISVEEVFGLSEKILDKKE